MPCSVEVFFYSVQSEFGKKQRELFHLKSVQTFVVGLPIRAPIEPPATNTTDILTVEEAYTKKNRFLHHCVLNKSISIISK